MKEAIPPVLAFGFEQMKLHTIMGSANPENTSSCLMIERNGFKREGTLRQSWFFNGVYSDSAIYGMLEEDYFAKS